jgi:ribosomal protein S18 acetylase RimI-like enzyme
MLDPEGFTGLIPIIEVAPEFQSWLDTFTCGRDSLDQFLCEQASALHRDHLSHTSVLFHEDFTGLVGYISMSNDAIPLRTSEVGDLGLAYHLELPAYPAVKIGKLAIHADLQGHGVGEHILNLAVGNLIGSPTVSTARLLITDAVNDDKVIRFYRRCGFEESYWASEQAKHHRAPKGKARETLKMLRDIYAV